MRQAGRALPEYRAAPRGHSYAAGLQYSRFQRPRSRCSRCAGTGVDAAIIFSDIVVPLKAIGVDLYIVAVVGIHPQSTHNLIGERELAMMKPTAILINTCRGPVVDEKALYNALRDEKILGAGLDVMVEEPPKPDHELFTLKNVIFSPHGAGPTWDNHWKRWRNAFDNFERVARGQKPFWIVPELRD